MKINRIHKNILVIFFFLIGINQVKSQDAEQIIIGTKHVFHSNILDEDREYWVSLPESYRKAELSYSYHT